MSRTQQLLDRTSTCKMPGECSIYTTWAQSQPLISSMVSPTLVCTFLATTLLSSCRDMIRTEMDVWTTMNSPRHWALKILTMPKCFRAEVAQIAELTINARTTSSPTPRLRALKTWCEPWSAQKAQKKPPGKACSATPTSTRLRPSASVTKMVMVLFLRTKSDAWWRVVATLSQIARLAP